MQSHEGGRPALLAVLAGAALALAAAPRNVVVLCLAFGPLLCLALERARSMRGGFFVAWLASFVTHAVVISWFVPLLLTYGGFPLPVALLVSALFFALQSLPFGLAGAAIVALRPAAREWITLPLALPVALTLVPEFLPWHVSTFALGFLPWVQCVELSGPATADVPLLYAGTALAFAWRARSARALAVGLVALALPLAYGYVRLAQVREARASWPLLRVGVVQPSFDIPKKFDSATFPTQIHILHALSRRLESRGAGLVVWPETAYPYFVNHGLTADRWDSEYGMHAEGVRGPLLVGVVTIFPARRQVDDEQRNSVIAIERDGTFAGIVDKRYLVPFTESPPFWEEVPALRRFYESRGITAGRRPELLTIAGARILILNCYEDVLALATAHAARARPSLLVNVTNDAWFGDTDEPWLHDAVARFRAIETRTDLVRVVNTGTSTHTAATGAELAHTPVFRPASFVANVRLRPARAARTPFVVLGDWLTPSLCGVLLGLCVRARSVRRSRAA